MNAARAFLLLVGTASPAMCQQGTVPVVDDAKQAAVIDQLAAKLSAGYVLPDSTPKIVQALRAAQQSGEYAQARTPQDFVAAVNRTLFTASHDKHLRLYYDPGSGSPISFPTSGKPRFNFGFNKVERLPGNIGYLELLSFQPPERAAETVRDFMGALANFDAVIVDLRNNGGGTTPGMALVASYFFAAEKVHLSNLYWRDTDTMVEIWTSPQAPGRHSPHQPLYILTSASTFSAAEDFTYSLQKLKRAIVIGERTGGGAHSGKGLQRLSPLFTAFIPVGRSFSPVTNTNWEGVGVEPDITTTAEQALHVAHMTALRRLLENESDEQWKQNLQTALQELSAPRQPR